MHKNFFNEHLYLKKKPFFSEKIPIKRFFRIEISSGNSSLSEILIANEEAYYAWPILLAYGETLSDVVLNISKSK